MTAPTCPIHGTPMAASTLATRPGFYCRSFVGLGTKGANAKGYCNQFLNAQAYPQASPTPVPAPAVAVAPPGQPAPSQTPSRASLACAALNAAAMLGGDPESVIITADRLLHGFLIPASQGKPVIPQTQDADIPF